MDIDRAIENYKQETETSLCRLMNACRSDKGSVYHQYTRFYASLFEPVRNEQFDLFEMGLGTNDVTIHSNMGPHGVPGASHFAWEIYFPNANIYGADIDKKIIFEGGRIKTYYCDQTNRLCIQEMWSNSELKDKTFHILIDDGLHTLEAAQILFENSIHKLAVGGVYIIEDIGYGTPIETMTPVVEEWSKQYPALKIKLVRIQTHKNTEPIDNWLCVCQRMRE